MRSITFALFESATGTNDVHVVVTGATVNISSYVVQILDLLI